MNPDTPDLKELRLLAEAAIEGRLTAAQQARLEQIVLTHSDARRCYGRYLHQHACLQWSAARPAVLAGSCQAESDRQARDGPAANQSAPVVALNRCSRGRWFGRWGMAWLALAASVALAVWFFSGREPGAIATLAEAKGCKWDAGSLPTEVGAILAPGRLRLAEGLARIVFASGAEVTLEGGADLELVSPMRCVIHAGELMAKVPPEAAGFVVETTSLVLTDLGTEFGVKVYHGKTADVQVFSGRVEALHRPTGRTEAMTTGNRLRFTPFAIRPFNSDLPKGDDAASQRGPQEGTRIVQISTAQGRGRDAFVQPIEIPPHRRSDTLLLVKHTVPAQANWNRKAYLGLDLVPLSGLRVLDAELSLTFAPTGMGFASQVPDATFVLYGLTDQALDDWDERTLRWQNAPANQPRGMNEPCPDQVVRLGSFELPQGQQSGTRTVSGRPLVDFLRRDSNQLVTFILVRETQGSGRCDLVHAIASRRHPSLSPPTLRVTVADPR